MWQLKVKEIKGAWETKKFGFVRILNERKIGFWELVKIVSCVRRILFFQRTLDLDFLRDLYVGIEGGLEQNPSAYFVVDLLVGAPWLVAAFGTDFCNPRWRCTCKLGALKKILARFSHNFDKWVRNSEVPGRLNAERNQAANLQQGVNCMTWMRLQRFQNDDQGEVVSFGCNINLISSHDTN